MTSPCPHCGGEINVSPPQQRCPHCQLKLEVAEPLPVLITKPKDRRGAERTTEWATQGAGTPALGIDPGSRNTALVVRDGDVVLHASTFVRVGNQDPVEYAYEAADFVESVRKDFPDIPMGLEGITDPKGFNRGKRAAINPKDIIRTATVAGVIAGIWRKEIIIIPPGGNGSQDLTQYPASLKGRRPSDLPGSSIGAGTRKHEQSAFDIAGKTADKCYVDKKVEKPS